MTNAQYLKKLDNYSDVTLDLLGSLAPIIKFAFIVAIAGLVAYFVVWGYAFTLAKVPGLIQQLVELVSAAAAIVLVAYYVLFHGLPADASLTAMLAVFLAWSLSKIIFIPRVISREFFNKTKYCLPYGENCLPDFAKARTIGQFKNAMDSFEKEDAIYANIR